MKSVLCGNCIYNTYIDATVVLARCARYISYIYEAESLFVSFYPIQIHISEPIRTKLCTMEETVGYVWSENV